MHNQGHALPRFGIGVDIESIDRFSETGTGDKAAFLKKVFTADELGYCLSAVSPAQHLAARFAAKEAIIKALAGLNVARISYGDIEVLNGKDGVPVASIHKTGFDNLQIKLSLSHSRNDAVAFSIVVQTAPPA